MARSTAIPVGEPPDALEAAVQHLGLRRDGLIELLACAQRQQGWLSAPLLGWIARRLQLPHSQVLGTASFYHLFRLQPPLPHSCLVCTGTACYMLGAEALRSTLQQQPLRAMGVELGTVRCIGSCSGAPLLVVDGRVLNHQNPARARRAVQAIAMPQP